VLCEVLTGLPPHGEVPPTEALSRARQGDLAGALARLDGCGADPELVELARRCLSADPADRPRDGAAVAPAGPAYQPGVQERLRRLERERAAAQARAVEERRRRRVQLALVMTFVLAGLLVSGAGWWWIDRQGRAERSAQEALVEAPELQRQGK